LPPDQQDGLQMKSVNNFMDIYPHVHSKAAVTMEEYKGESGLYDLSLIQVLMVPLFVKKFSSFIDISTVFCNYIMLHKPYH
jgi:hypothetical protein